MSTMLRTVEQIKASPELALDANPLNTLTGDQAEALVDLEEQGKYGVVEIQMSLTEIEAIRMMRSMLMTLKVIEDGVKLRSGEASGGEDKAVLKGNFDKMVEGAARVLTIEWMRAEKRVRLAKEEDARLQHVRANIIAGLKTLLQVNVIDDASPVFALARLFVRTTHVLLLPRSTDAERLHAQRVFADEHKKIAGAVAEKAGRRSRFVVAG